MAGSLTSTCPECGTDIQSTWRWCLACGYDPDHLRPVTTGASASSEPGIDDDHARRRPVAPTTTSARSGAWFYVAVVVASLVAAAIVYNVRSRSTTADAPAGGPPATVVPPGATWARFSPPNEGFTVELPGKVATQPPQKLTMAGASTTIHAFTSVTGTTTMGVTYADLGDATKAAPETLLNDLLKEAADTLGGSVQSSQLVDDDGHQALDYVIDIRGTGKNQGRIVIVGTRVYTLNVIGPEPRAADVDRLLNSFTPS
jgi:hypothetical protein